MKIMLYRILAHALKNTLFMPIYVMAFIAWLSDQVMGLLTGKPNGFIYCRRGFARWWVGKDKVNDDGSYDIEK